jgi:membrane protein implicated in regulation of membrane protease activity
MAPIMFDIISWVGLTICIGAFFIKDVFWLRLATLVGCSLLFIYYSHIAIPQGVISNLLVLLINAYYLLRFAQLRRKEKSAQLNAMPANNLTVQVE